MTDPPHKGHRDHCRLAKKLGDWLIVSIQPDSNLVKKKGYCLLPLEHRKAVIEEWRCVDEVIVTLGEDGLQAETLKLVRPDIFAKGGDRTPDNMPQAEIDACQEIGCEIVYGVGDKIGSSKEFVKAAMRKI